MENVSEVSNILFNTVKACMGAGINSYPGLFSKFGVIRVLVVTILSALASVLGAFVYIDLNAKHNKFNSISTLSSIVISPFFKYIVDLTVIAKCITVGAGYLSLSRSLIKDLTLFNEYSWLREYKGFVFITVFSLLVTPTIFSPTLKRLKYLSYFGTFTIFLLIAISFAQSSGKEMKYELLTQDSNILKNIGSFVFSFSCHQSILNIHNESSLKDSNLKKLVFGAFCIVSLLQLVFGFLNYSAFSYFNGRFNIIDNLYVSWGKGPLTTFAIISFAFSLIISVPFQIHPAKTYLGDMLKLKQQTRSLVVCAMVSLCLFLGSVSWINFDEVSKKFTKPMNTMLCFGYPLLYSIFANKNKKLTDWGIILYLSAFTALCFLSMYQDLK